MTEERKGVILEISGNVLSVLEGRVDVGHMQKIDPSHFQFALGAGSFSDQQAVGETLVLDSKPYISWKDNKILHTEHHSSFHSPFLMGINPQPSDGETHYYKESSPFPLQTLYEKLAREHPRGIAVVGYCLFEKADSTYLKKAPIFHENINENSSIYWADMSSEQQRTACFFGVVIPKEAEKFFSSSLLQKAFYQNPKESHSAPFASHTHAALLDSTASPFPKTLEEFKKARTLIKPVGIRHFLNSSIISEGIFSFFPIKTITAC